MKLKCVRCGARSKMALCNDCRLDTTDTLLTETSLALKDSLPKLPQLTYMGKVFYEESKEYLTLAFNWLRNDSKRYVTFKNWGLNFNKQDALRILKDTALVLLPFFIAFFIVAKIVVNRLPDLATEFVSSGTISQMLTFWLLNFALGIGITVSAKISGGISFLSISASGSGTVRIIASGLTVILVYFLVKRSRERLKVASFTMNTQTEILTTGLVLALITFLTTFFSSSSLQGSASVKEYSGSISLSVAPDYYSLFISPLLICVVVVVLARGIERYESNVSESIKRITEFFLSTAATIAVVAILSFIVDRQFANLILLILFLPTITIFLLAGASGVPITGNDSFGTELFTHSLFNPNTTVFVTSISLILTIALLGALLGFRHQPDEYDPRSVVRASLGIGFTSVLLSIFLSIIAFGSASAVFGLAQGGKSIFIAPNLGVVLLVGIIWGLSFQFGSRYLTPMAAQFAPVFFRKYLPKVKIFPSTYYAPQISAEYLESLSPLEKQTRIMYRERRVKFAKRFVLAGLAVFLITGPLNHTIAERISSPSSTINGFFDSLIKNDAGKAKSLIAFDDSRKDVSQAGLTSQALSGYSEKIKVTKVTLNQDYDPNVAYADVEYTLNGTSRNAQLEVFKDTVNKKFGLFPTWKLRPNFLASMQLPEGGEVLNSWSGQDLPKGISAIYLFPGVAEIKNVFPYGTRTATITSTLQGNSETVRELDLLSPNAREYALSKVRNNLEDCIAIAFTSNENTVCPSPTSGYVSDIKVSNFRELSVSDIEMSNHNLYFRTDFKANVTYTDSWFGTTNTVEFSTENRNFKGALVPSSKGIIVNWDNYATLP